uniref:Complex III subunit 9 n=1 Tax=Podarcis muralis TaxID=64176 RepID=A0A670KH04_PODMU
LAAAMTLAKQVYRVLLRRSATFALTVVVGALLFERAFDQSADSIFEQVNKEVSRLPNKRNKDPYFILQG